jgi:hypothetical protein
LARATPAVVVSRGGRVGKERLRTWVEQLGVFRRDPGLALYCDGLLGDLGHDGLFVVRVSIGVAVSVPIRVPLHLPHLLGPVGGSDRHSV